MATKRTITTYTFSELTPSAQARVIERLQEEAGRDFSDFGHDFPIENATTIAGLLGIDLDTYPVRLMSGKTRHDPAIFYSGFCSQGDGACFTGTWRAADLKVDALIDHAPADTKLHAIASNLATIAAQYPHALADVTRERGARYCHEYTADVENALMGDDEGTELPEDVRKEIETELRAFMKWIYRSLKQEYTYRTSEEACREDAEQRDDEYTADGERWRD